MLIRSAFWLGQPKSGFEDEFRKAIDGELMPGFMTLPGVTNARALWPEKFEDNPPPVYCQVLVEFADEAGKAAMLASSGRQVLRARVAELIANFSGHLSHIDYQVG